MNKIYTNNLINEKSPYLLQHAHNPVDWFPWGNEAFQKAKKENKPIFLSIGYSTCHWCHVMEKESFEDEEVANWMNQAFINIKVDREERPDIDNVYMTVCQIVNGNGGWPLSIVMTPNKKPFFAGTYIPKTSRNGKLGMIDMAKRTLEIWKNNKEDILKSAEELTSHLNTDLYSHSGIDLDSNIYKKTYHELASNYDPDYGGFGNSPKFPIPHNLIFLTRYAQANPNSEAREMIENTLIKMRLGGIYDHIGKGFHRYSTDREWIVPHFEKMLYDQALMIIAYSEGYALTKNELFKETVYEITDYLNREMKDKSGAYYSAEDADSEGEEGKFYTWTLQEIRENLPGNVELFVKLFNISNTGNYLEEMTRDFNGKNIIYQKKTIEEFANYNNLPIDESKAKIKQSLSQLYKIREKRVKPSKDTKILTDWNGLLASAFAIAGNIFNDDGFLNNAKEIIDFIYSKMFHNQLLHRCKDGDAGINGLIDDYAFTIWGLIELYQSTFNINYLEMAIELQDLQINNFYDENNGGFYFTPNNGETLIARKKELYDGAMPSGNSVTYMNLNRLYKITGNTKYSEIADKTQKLFASQIMNSPSAYTQFIIGNNFISKESEEIVLVGNSLSNLSEFINVVNQKYKPYSSIILKTIDNELELQKLASFSHSYIQIEDKPTAYICKDFVCKNPINKINDFKNEL